MKKMISTLAALAVFSAVADDKVTAYRLHIYTKADGAETAYVVGADGVERPVVLVTPDEYDALTNRLETVWRSYHSTADGRKRLHGKIERTEIDGKLRQKTEIHADGYRHVEPFVEVAKTHKPTVLQKKIVPQKPKGMSEKQWEMRKAFAKHRMGVPKTVTVEHDAATGKDTVLEGK